MTVDRPPGGPGSPDRRDRETPPDGSIRIGTAGWTIPRENAGDFSGDGTHLERYARRLSAAEINSTFYKPHRPGTFERWGESVPADFRFSVKLPKATTHTARLRDADELLGEFLEGVGLLGDRLGCLLVQLPPSFAFEAEVAESFLTSLRARYEGGVALEPRHATWLEPAADGMLVHYRVARVAADPDNPPGAAIPGGWDGLRYYRLHGSPRMYYSSYPTDYLAGIAEALSTARREGA